jgi:predicted XRE-type DNA-binding protein
MNTNKPIITRNAQELASVLGLPPAKAREWEARAALADRIVALVRRERITHAEIARRVGTSRTRITSILNGNLGHVSTDLLIRILGGLGYKVRFTVSRDTKAAA